MEKYRKKPVVIEAVQFNGRDNSGDVLEFTDWQAVFTGNSIDDCWLEIPTLEGTMKARPGDWIIKGVNGEFYPCKPDIFAATYEAA